MNDEHIYWNALRLVFDLGPHAYRRIRKHFRSAKRAFKGTADSYRRYGFRENFIEKLPLLHDINPDDAFDFLIEHKITLLMLHEKDYPKRLKNIPSPPPTLYFRGNIDVLAHENLIAVVGTRRATAYGKSVTKKIAGELARNNCIIVSGMALGIDTEAHKAALENRKPTIAVLGSGLDDASLYPQSNLSLAKHIEKHGLILSEHPIGVQPFAPFFPRRNRIVSGLSRGVIVCEAKQPSGALITARLAAEQGREVFAVPGSIFSSTAKGTHKLLREGAHIAENASDILDELRISRSTLPADEDSVIVRALREKPLTFEGIMHKTGLTHTEIQTRLIELEIDGRVAKNGGMYYKV